MNVYCHNTIVIITLIDVLIYKLNQDKAVHIVFFTTFNYNIII